MCVCVCVCVCVGDRKGRVVVWAGVQQGPDALIILSSAVKRLWRDPSSSSP